MNEKQQKVISNLFDKDDYVHLKNRFEKKDGTLSFNGSNWSVNAILNGQTAEYVCVNPLDPEAGDGKATLSNVLTYRTLVFEEDDTTVEEQLKKLKKARIPFSNLVWSGNTSLHCTISLEEPIESEAEYRATFHAIRNALKTYDYDADKACKNPNRLTRMPGGLNNKTGNIQEVRAAGKRVPNSLLAKWLADHSEDIQDYMPKPYEFTKPDGPDTANDVERWEFVKRICKEARDYNKAGDGNREPIRFRLSQLCKSVSLSEAAAVNFISSEFPSSEGRRKIEEEVRKNYKREVEHIPVMSKEEWIEIKNAEKKAENDEQFAHLLDNDYNLESSTVEEEVINAESDKELFRYIMVGDDIYFVANRRLYKRQIGTFTLHFPKRELNNIPRFTDFCNEPGYFNYKPIVNNKFNKFKMPTWKPKSGDWSTIEHYLRHITSGDEQKYQMMLDYFQISLQDPKQKLPILILLSYEKGSGKSTFYDLLQAMFGENVEPVTPRNFELEWNTQWCEKHFVFLDEMEKIKDKEAIGGKIKQLAYFNFISKNRKGKDTETIPWNGRLIMTSNEEAGFIEIDQHEDRYLILKVPARTSFNKDYVQLLRDQVPQFINALMNRQLSTEGNGRGWFTKEELKTRALDAIVHNSKPEIDIAIEKFITEWFEDNPKKDEMNFLIKDIEFNIGAKWDNRAMRDSIYKLYKTINNRKYTAEDSCNGFQKKQKHWFTIKRELVMTNEDLNQSIETAYNELA